MTTLGTLKRLAMIVALTASTACSNSQTNDAPGVPAMPAHWKVVSDLIFSDTDIKPIAGKLGGGISALRNTTYNVGDNKHIKLNTIVAVSPEDADKIIASLEKMKPAEWFVRRGATIYEFVGNDDVAQEMRAGRALLAEE